MGQLVQRQASDRAAAQAAAVAAAPQQYLTFTLGGEMFAVAILNVKEIIEFGSLTEIPMTPPFIRGVINLRGAVVPVIDLACRFGGQPSAVARRTCIVIVELEEDEQKSPHRHRRRRGIRGPRHPGRGHRAASRIRCAYPHRLHQRHGQDQRQVRCPARRQPDPLD